MLSDKFALKLSDRRLPYIILLYIKGKITLNFLLSHAPYGCMSYELEKLQI